MNSKIILKTILIIVWMFTIFNFSSQNGTESSGTSDKILVKIIEVVKNKQLNSIEKEEYINKYSFVIRKAAHFTAYFILGLLVLWLIKDLYYITPTTFIFSLIFCFIYSCTDEIHQLFINGRHGSLIDVLIDTSGALTAITIFYLILKKRIK